MRESLFEKEKRKKICFEDEYNKIKKIIGSSEFREYLRTGFKKCPYKCLYATYDDAIKSIVFDDDVFIDSLDAFLDLLEFLRTLLVFIDIDNLRKYGENCEYQSSIQLANLIDFDAEKLGYGFLPNEKSKTFDAYLKDPITESVALKANDLTKDKIYNYLVLRKGMVNEKRLAIKDLADDIENLCKKYNNDPYSKTREFLQCVRHTKEKQNINFYFYYENEEYWLDKCFDMIVGILGFENTKEAAKEIREKQNQNK